MKRRRIKGGSLDIASETEEEASHNTSEANTEDITEEASDNKLFAYVVIGLILIVAAVFFSMSHTKKEIENQNIYTYNGFTIVNVSGFWLTQIQNPQTGELKNVEMRLDPRTVENIPATDNVLDTILSSEKIYLTVSPNLTSKAVIGMTEVSKVLGDRVGLYNIPTKGALTDVLVDDGTPQVTCKNATNTTKVIYFLVAENTGIAVDGNCILVAGTDEDELIRASDKLSYMLLGII